MGKMTDQEAFRLIEKNLQLLRESYHWGKIEIEVKDGRVSRINLTVPVKLKGEDRETDRK
jgi:hypothetical protein